MVADRAREQWLPSIGTRKRAYRLEGLILVHGGQKLSGVYRMVSLDDALDKK